MVRPRSPAVAGRRDPAGPVLVGAGVIVGILSFFFLLTMGTSLTCVGTEALQACAWDHDKFGFMFGAVLAGTAGVMITLGLWHLVQPPA